MGFGLIIRNGRIVDGSGNPWFYADLGIKNGRISSIGNLSGEDGERVIDASGCVVSPGFVDIHSHTDVFHIINPTGDSFIMQGVTTNLIGNCGGSVAPVSEFVKQGLEDAVTKYHLDIDWVTFDDYYKKLEKKPPSLNTCSLVGQGTVRMAAMGMEKRAPTNDELERTCKYGIHELAELLCIPDYSIYIIDESSEQLYLQAM